ncbi:hypothetical protein BC828DRAFT_121777 [Blastocladiella britannica]|nr:hypothetical protein BC828DRAFT_121777 [Blastocladiella britannica]
MRSIPFLAALFSIASLIVSPTHAMGRPLSNHKRYTADQIPTQEGHMVVQHPKHGAIIVKIGGNVAAKSYDDDEFTSDDGYNYDD